MIYKIKYILFVITMLIVLYMNPSTVYASELPKSDTGVTEISTALDLFNVYHNPYGSYILTCDIDMDGLIWLPIPLYGSLDGNGYAIKNLHIELTGSDTRVTYDGNYKKYQTCFSGLFSVLENATVKNLTLDNIDIVIDTPTNCFIGAVAGYMSNSVIQGCIVNGNIDLTTTAPMFGTGGFVGFGNGTVNDSIADVVLICTDSNIAQKDEQFLGGVFADGLFSMNRNHIKMQGYISDHGYVHSGGMGGMIIKYLKDLDGHTTITDNIVTGKITFFEDNRDRRAYCKDIIGEYMYKKSVMQNNVTDFIRDERFDYSINLKPENNNL